MDWIIRLEQVHFTYASDSDRPVKALDGIDLSIEPGEYLAVLGHNGSGKSTLARHLNGLLLPTSGRVLVKQWDTAEPAALRPIRSTVGMVFQNPDNQIVATIVEEDVAFGPENLGVAPEEIVRRVEEALSEVGLLELRQRAPHLLSGGQKQRVCIAGALALRPEVLVLDESTAMLDPVGRRHVLRLVRRLNRKAGMAVVAITHHMEEAVHADRVIVMAQGRIVLQGRPREVFGQPERLQELAMEVPQITDLAHRLHRRHPRFPPDVLGIEDFVSAVSREVRRSQREAVSSVPAETAGPAAEFEREAAGETAIRVERLSHVYLRGTPLQTRALDGVTMDVRKGEILGVIGATGSGKSTLIQHLNALLRPHGGRVLAFGRDTRSEADVKEIRRRVGFVFQQPEAQLFEPYVGDDVAYGPRNWKLSAAEVRERVRRAMESVGLGFEEFKDRLTFGLSGGQMRRVALAGVLALEPDCLVLDEPTAGLDPRGRRLLLDQLTELRRRHGTTLVLVSHDMEQLARVCDRIAVVDQGRLAMLAPPAAVYAETEWLQQLQLEAPAVTRAMQALGRLGLVADTTPVLDVETAASLLLPLLNANGPTPGAAARDE